MTERLLAHADYLDRQGRQSLAAELRAVVDSVAGGRREVAALWDLAYRYGPVTLRVIATHGLTEVLEVGIAGSARFQHFEGIWPDMAPIVVEWAHRLQTDPAAEPRRSP